MSLSDLLGRIREKREAAPSTAETETVRKIAAELDRLDPERARYIAAFAFLMSRVARADLTISDVESREMERIVMQLGDLPEAQAVIVVQMAKSQSVLFGGTENFLVTREFAAMASRDQKIALLHCLFSVSAADESISSAEDTTIRKIASEIGFEREDFIAVRSAYKDLLEVRKRLSGERP
jgi:uncharacterized tellurite resistance protein B-like protein